MDAEKKRYLAHAPARAGEAMERMLPRGSATR